MGWLRLVGSLKVQISFAEYRLFYRALLQKKPIVLIVRGCVCISVSVSLCVYVVVSVCDVNLHLPILNVIHVVVNVCDMGWLQFVGSLKI